MDEEIEKRVKHMTFRDFSISQCPEDIWEKFMEFAKIEAKNSYAIALKLLLDRNEVNAISLFLYERLQVLEDRVNEWENKCIKNKTKRMGSRGE